MVEVLVISYSVQSAARKISRMARGISRGTSSHPDLAITVPPPEVGGSLRTHGQAVVGLQAGSIVDKDEPLAGSHDVGR